MGSIHFEVSAKAARLIGRENISNVDGALIELIKNAYDADAECVYVVFNMPFPYVPYSLSSVKINEYLSEEDKNRIVDEFYYQGNNGEYIKRELDGNQSLELKKLLMNYNTIIIADNGIGMTESDVKTKWMYIATSDKEGNPSSPKGRVKTGAKGIGRFALDKLSLKTKMYTQTGSSDLIHWEIDWEQFSNTKVLGQISADYEIVQERYSDIINNYIGNHISKESEKGIKNWSHGTMLVMHPIREEWSERTFEKVNLSLHSINPMGDADPFKVHIRNRYFEQYNYDSSETSVDAEDYDYKISIEYDGDLTLTTTLCRNEVNTSVESINFKDIEKTISTSSFWDRPFFKTENHNKDDYNASVKYSEKVSDLFNDDISKIRSVGSFSGELFFIKSSNSQFGIIKQIKPRKRKALLDNFSGIKIYRDHFKVRPYGDRGEFYDWLGLQLRQTKSPGGVADKGQSWKVLAYQIIGQIQISRFENQELKDTANREGLEQNDEYRIFIDMILHSISLFETDRGLFYKEFAEWYKDVENSLSPKQDLINRVVESKESHISESDDVVLFTEDEGDSGYSDAEYQNAIYDLVLEKREEIGKTQILQMLASSSLILSTFFHEFKAMQVHFKSIPPQLRVRAENILEITGYEPTLMNNPFVLIDDLEKQDKMLSMWLRLALNGVEKKSIELYSHSLRETIGEITRQWEEILAYYGIDLHFISEEDKSYDYDFADVDLYIIINNFILNSVYFLQEERNEHRMISIQLKDDNEYYSIMLHNNGPKLDSRYSAMPEQIFELGVTSKDKDGTGLGLWISQETITRYSGSIVYVPEEEGFSLNAFFRK